MNVINQARRVGAKLHRFDNGRWAVLDMPGTPLWTLTFSTAERAAVAYLIVTRR